MSETEIPSSSTIPAYLPAYPEPLLDDNPEYDIPPYSGDVYDLTERRNVKLYNVWTVWSDLRKNERLLNLLQTSADDTEDMKYVKAMLTIAMDRLGKCLGHTNIVEELCVKKSKLTEKDVKQLAKKRDEALKTVDASSS